MRPLALCLLLAATAVFAADEAKPKVVIATPVERPLPSEKTKLPWHMVNLWWTMPETADFESLEIDVTISDDVDPSKLNLYIAPIGLGQLNDTNFYGGIQSNIGGYPVSDASPQGDYHKGKGAIFSRWGNKDIDTSFVRPAVNGLTEAAGYEGDFASGRRPFPWKAGTYTYAIRKLTYEKDKDGKEWTWVGAFLTEKSSGQTVFITSLVANLMDRGRMPQLLSAAAGTIRTAFLQPQPDDTLPRFDYEANLARLTAKEPTWPSGTRRISELRLSFRIEPKGALAGLRGARTVHLDIVDYPGEWLLDLGLMEMSFEAWSERTLQRLDHRPLAADFLARLSATDASAEFTEEAAQDLAKAYTDHLHAARDAGYSDCSPGRFLLPGEMEGSPVLSFAPLRKPEKAGKASLWHEFERRFESYKKKVVGPFFREHFARIDRQIVLVDVLGAIHAGPRAVEDLRQAMADILVAFRPGKSPFLARLLGGKRIERILFAATKADHLHHSQHPRLTAITEALLRGAKDRADFAGAETAAMSIAALRTTVEDTVTREGEKLDVVRGRLLDSGRLAAFYAGELPEDPAHLLTPAREGATAWLDTDYEIMQFAPAPLTLRPGDGPPHIRLDKAAQFLIGDKL